MLELHSCGYHFVHPDGLLINRPAGSGDYAFVFFKSNAMVRLQDSDVPVAKNSFILFRPKTPHGYRDVEAPFINDWFHCEGDDVQELLQTLNFPMDKPVKASDPQLISRCIMELQSAFRSGGPLRNRIIDCDLRSFFMKLSDVQGRTAHPEKLNRHYVQFSELRNELYSSPHTYVSIPELASHFNMSKSHFQHIYKDLFGCSVMSDIINARLDYAKYLLDHSGLAVAEIAKLCGYENDTHFMRQFKKFVGVSPRKYKFRNEA
ncbi:AraC family transcriptional regulator, arabinose operon regulatory protein [Paenibacillus sp. UNCCL117]|uniref:AraC family transcriptional regulator n=1 Tax=unclassified Paenibacillus TaxID=185978 RepID=UPI0008854B2D|nr:MULTISPECIES: AraC family transcriptional regulator [unclassified Paenibacillus]SDD55413.1 AraC family transcriptional regulator, arabinose operon regulatory protein [Paenibacillus sp. cl123]SFW51595.1 AraC family transcriptional regulator, arabinose operon regulatory protein [Paenibacillus sp. UNCCL117]